MRRRMMMNNKKKEVPEEYKRLDAIFVPTKAWLNTGLKLTQNDTICINYKSVPHNYGASIFYSNVVFAGYTRSTNMVYYKFGDASGSIDIPQRVKHEIIVNNSGVYVDGSKVANIATEDFSSSSFLIPSNISNGNVNAYYGTTTYYESYIIKDGKKIKIIPCQRIGDGRIGFYLTGIEQFKPSSGQEEFRII